MLSAEDGGGYGGAGEGEPAASSPPEYSAPAATLTGSDLVKGGEVPVLLASDSLGRVGLLRYPAQLPPEPALPIAAPAPAEEGGTGAEGGDAGEGAPPAPTPEEAEAAAAATAAAAEVMAQAIEAAVPRVCCRMLWPVSICSVRSCATLLSPASGYSSTLLPILPNVLGRFRSSFLDTSTARNRLLSSRLTSRQRTPSNIPPLRANLQLFSGVHGEGPRRKGGGSAADRRGGRSYHARSRRQVRVTF